MIADRLRDDVKQALSDPRRVADLLGLDGPRKPQAGGFSGKCPKCGGSDSTNKCSWTKGPDGTLRVCCFSCQFKGDLFSVVAAVRGLDIARDFPAVLAVAAALAGLETPTAPTPRPTLRPVAAPPPDLSVEWAALGPVSADVWEYLRGRNLDGAADFCRSPDLERLEGALATARQRSAAGEKFGDLTPREQTAILAAAGYSLAVALRDGDGRVVGLQLRQLGAHEFRVVGSSSAGLFGDPQAVRTAGTVLICEGLSDTLAAVIGMRGVKQPVAIVGIAGTQATGALATLPFGGRRVLIATDADSAGDKAAEAIGSLVLRLGGKPTRLRPEGGKDLADMHAAGICLLTFARNAVARAGGFVSAAERVRDERTNREVLVSQALPFGIRFLDMAFGGILPNDELLVGAGSGCGKTELAKIVAQHNAMQGRRVFGFFLEAHEKEIERRIKFNLLSRRVFDADSRIASQRWNYLDWFYGRCNDLCDRFEAEAEAEFRRLLQTLFTFYRVQEFTAAQFANAFAQVAEQADLVLLDHFHFLDAEERESTSAQRRAAAKIRGAVMAAGKPLVMIAHIRKLERKGKKPQIILLGDDFQGASEVWKAATQAVMLSKATNVERQRAAMWPTYINPVKLRLDGQRARYCALVDFDASRGAYAEEFKLGQASFSGDEWTELEAAEWPEWARVQNEAPSVRSFYEPQEG